MLTNLHREEEAAASSSSDYLQTSPHSKNMQKCRKIQSNSAESYAEFAEQVVENEFDWIRINAYQIEMVKPENLETFFSAFFCL